MIVGIMKSAALSLRSAIAACQVIGIGGARAIAPHCAQVSTFDAQVMTIASARNSVHGYLNGLQGMRSGGLFSR